ncbi:MAG TPA: hypothetical protein VGF74_11430 [Thermoleophilaceae bacterium]|jgi:Kef-type K+ transport system membrane component KefB
MRAFERLYGASPLHLLAHLAAFATAGYALLRILQRGPVQNFVIWFVGAALLHDLLFVPLYSLLDAIARRGSSEAASRARVPPLNYVRVPALLSGVLLLVYFPLILGEGSRNYLRATGHHPTGYARNWLLVTAVLFGGSALLYALRLRGRTTGVRRSSGR